MDGKTAGQIAGIDYAMVFLHHGIVTAHLEALHHALRLRRTPYSSNVTQNPAMDSMHPAV